MPSMQALFSMCRIFKWPRALNGILHLSTVSIYFLIKLPKVIAFTVQQCSIVLFSVFGITSIVSHAIVNKQ